jgi:RTX calcium-binding nonapeptide repeat (4 copies)
MTTRRKTRRSLNMESLENRQMMAANLTVALTDGVLAIVGTEQADTIVVRQVNNRLSVDGVSGSFDASNVKGIAIDSRGGHDYVAMDVAGQVVFKPTIIDAGAGNDHIRGGYGDDVVNLGAGDDITVTHGGHDRVYGGAGNDRIWTGDGNDKVSGDDGNDEIVLGAGNDLVYSGAGHDRIWGETGDDRVSAGDGDDWVFGGAGSDAIYGESGADEVFGELGNDVLMGGNGIDKLRGGDGDDQLYGEAEADWLYGDAGNDTLFGGTGSDRIYGGLGDDRLNGDAGSDYLYGQEGYDRFYDSFAEAWTSRNDWRLGSESWNIPTNELAVILAAAANNYRASIPVPAVTQVVPIPTLTSTTALPAGLTNGGMFSFSGLFAPGTIGGDTQATLAQQYQNALKTYTGPKGGDRSQYFDSMMGNIAANEMFSALTGNFST